MTAIYTQGSANADKHKTKNPLYLAAGWMADKRISKTKQMHTSDMVANLLSHGARSWRMSQPRASINLLSFSAFGQKAIHLRVR